MRNEKTRQETAHLNLIEHTILTLDLWQDNVTYTEVKTPLNAEQEKSLLDFRRTDHAYRAYYDKFVILHAAHLLYEDGAGRYESQIPAIHHGTQKYRDYDELLRP